MPYTTKQKNDLKLRAFKYLEFFGKDIRTKIQNVCSKTTVYDVPPELFQKRCKRSNRALISWGVVKQNNITFDQLNAFQSGIVVEFVNNDYFVEMEGHDALFEQLKDRLGSDDNVSAMISLKSEEGKSSSAVPREAFRKLTNDYHLNYKGQEIIITSSNYRDYAIKQVIKRRGQGNDTWSGFLYVSIKGGQQDIIETHAGEKLTLFNPAREYASDDVSRDIDLVMSYYALTSIDEETLSKEPTKIQSDYPILIQDIEKALKTINYDNDEFNGSLFDFVKNHYSIAFVPGHLTDPIQLTDITIDKFNKKDRDEDNIDVAHEEAAVFEKYYWDKEKKCLLSAARPTNLFWSYHLSNMMQQNYGLDEYFEFEEQRFNRRHEMINKAGNHN